MIAVFAAVLILFNPLLPIYQHKKSIWIPLDIIVGILFLLPAFLKIKIDEQITEEKKIRPVAKEKYYQRDRIIITKKQN